MQTENKNMQTDYSAIVAQKLLVRDMFIFIVRSGVCSICVYKLFKKMFKLGLNKAN